MSKRYKHNHVCEGKKGERGADIAIHLVLAVYFEHVTSAVALLWHNWLKKAQLTEKMKVTNPSAVWNGAGTHSHWSIAKDIVHKDVEYVHLLQCFELVDNHAMSIQCDAVARFLLGPCFPQLNLVTVIQDESCCASAAYHRRDYDRGKNKR